MWVSFFFVCLYLVALVSTAGPFPPTPSGVTTIKSRFGNDATISYKEVRRVQPAMSLCSFS